MTWVALFGIAFGLLIVFLVVQTRRAGPMQVDANALAGGEVLLEARRDEGGEPWGKLGNRTTARGLDLRFDHDDDPGAEATIYAPGVGPGDSRSSLARPLTVRLTDRFETHHVQMSGYVFEATLRGAPGVVGREVRIQMVIGPNKRPLGGRIENDDDTDAAVGDWIEIERARIVRLRPGDGQEPR